MSQQAQIDHLETLIHEKQRELRRHRERAAAQGFDTPPWVLNRIEDLETEIEDLLLELEGLKKLPPDPPAPALPSSPRSSWWVKLIPTGLALVGLALTVALVSSFASGSGDASVTTAASIASRVTATVPLTPTVEPMPETSFNIAVAQFSDLTDPHDSLLTSGESIALSERLFDTISATAASLPASYTPKLRSPAQVGPVPGESPAEREENAARLAAKHNATVLIYGSVVKTADGIYLVQPEFDVSKEGFRYGDEILGTHQLGGPVQFRPPLAQPGLVQKINEDLDGRIQALTLIVEGLAEYHYGHAGLAYEKFKLVLAAKEKTDGWQLDEGQEVVHLLMGAAKLLEYDDLVRTSIDSGLKEVDKANRVLQEAGDHFQAAFDFNQNYVRSYLGLGAVALYRATVLEFEQTRIRKVDLKKLQEAKYWFSESLSKRTDQSSAAFVSVKAAFGLGQTYLLEYSHSLGQTPAHSVEEAKQQAANYFRQVIVAYNEAGQISDLAFMAGRSRVFLALLAGYEEQYELAITHCDAAIEIFESLKVNRPLDIMARCYYYTAYAYANRVQPDNVAARVANDKAIELGEASGLIPEAELQNWRMHRTGLN